MAVIPTLDVIYTLTRATLADVDGDVWDDATLAPFVRRACHKVARVLRAAGTGLFRKQSGDVAVAANTVSLSRTTGYPTDMIRPIEIREKKATDAATEYKVMRSQAGFLPPEVPVGDYRQYWDWITDTLVFPPASAASTFQIQYEAGFTDPASWTTTPNLTSINIPDSEEAIALLAASFACASRDEAKNAKALYDMGMEDVQMLVDAERNVLTARAARYGGQ